MKRVFLEMASNLDHATQHAEGMHQLSLSTKFGLNEAYEIQRHTIERRYSRGEELTGYKLGFTSKAKMEQMDVDELIWGRLTNLMEVKDSSDLHLKKYIHPRAEPEIAFRVSRSIDQVLTLENAADYFDGIAPALEIVDSRYKDFKFSLEDVVADNSSSAGYVLGSWFDHQTQCNDLDISLVINGITRQRGNSNAILGNPIRSMIKMSEIGCKYNLKIEKGHILLAGAATTGEYIHPGDKVEAVFQHLGKVQFQVKE